MTTITRENFTASLERAVAERGEDFVYPEAWMTSANACQYSLRDGTPACIIGLALSYIDPGIVPGSGEFGSSDAGMEELGVEDDVLIIAARAAQIRQDRGYTWGRSLDAYKAVLEENS